MLALIDFNQVFEVLPVLDVVRDVDHWCIHSPPNDVSLFVLDDLTSTVIVLFLTLLIQVLEDLFESLSRDGRVSGVLDVYVTA